MKKRFPNSKIICVGQRLSEMPDDVCYIKYVDTFGKNSINNVWQPKLFNWYMSISQEVL